MSSQTAGYNDTSSPRQAGIGFGRRNDYLLLIVNAACEVACSPAGEFKYWPPVNCLDNVFGDRVDIYVKSCRIVKVARSKSEHLTDSSAGIGSIRVIFFSSECVSPQGMELP